MLRKLTFTTVLTLSLMSLPLLGQQAKSQSQTAGAKTLTGVVSDSMCGAKHMAKDKSAAECTRECVKSGSDYALLVGKNVYVLKGDKTAIDKFAGEEATVKGTLSGNTVTVQSIAPTKKKT